MTHPGTPIVTRGQRRRRQVDTPAAGTETATGIAERDILHVIVGHGLPTMFVNTVESFRAVCPESELLVVDNASPQPALRATLKRRAAADPHMEYVLREDNALDSEKVGALYAAYRMAFDTAEQRGFRFVHLLQGDMQVLWWDADARGKLAELYRRHPNCVNVHTRAFSSDRALMGDIAWDEAIGATVIPHYGVTDTGVFHLGRWRSAGMRFLSSEEETAAAALDKGLVTVVSPWPTEVPVPWPAVVRHGRQVGREVRTAKPFLCRPLDAASVAAVKQASVPVPWETLCTPWGWWCLAPMSETDLSHWYYLNYRRHALRRHGWRGGRPRWVTGGLDHRWDVLRTPHRPSVMALLCRPLPSFAGELARRLATRASPRGDGRAKSGS